MSNEQGKYLRSIACLDTQGCGSSDAMAIYIHEDDSIKNGYCYSCHKWFSADEIEKGEKLPIKRVKKVYTGESVEDVLQYPILALEDRGISKEAAEFFGVRTSFNETTREPECRYFPHYQNGHLFFMKKWVDKSHPPILIGNISGQPIEFFGQNLTKGTKFIIIVEGQEDALAAWDILKKNKRNYNVVSLPNGANPNAIKNNFKWIYEFTQVALAFDSDQPGEKATKEVVRLLDPGQVKVLEFKDFKDTNDYLKAGADKAWMNCLYNAVVRKPDGIITASDVWDEAIRRPEWGLDWPWPSLTTATFGRRRGEIIGIGAGSGVGKTSFIQELVSHVIFKDEKPIGAAFLEEVPVQSLKRVAGKVAGKTFHIPDTEYKDEELEGALRKIDSKLWLYDSNGMRDWASIKQFFKFVNKVYGCQDLILDNLSPLTASEESEYNTLNEIMKEIASLSIELDATIYFLSHLRKATGSKSHEEGAYPQLVELKGSGSIASNSNFIFGLQRNLMAEDLYERNTMNLSIMKDRYSGMSTGKIIPLFYDKDTGILREKTEEDTPYSDF